VLLGVGGVGAFDFVGAVGEQVTKAYQPGSSPAGLMAMKVFPAWSRSSSSMNRPSSEGSSTWSPFSVSAV
jgi:hypothetical protein